MGQREPRRGTGAGGRRGDEQWGKCQDHMRGAVNGQQQGDREKQELGTEERAGAGAGAGTSGQQRPRAVAVGQRGGCRARRVPSTGYHGSLGKQAWGIRSKREASHGFETSHHLTAIL